MAKKQPPAKKPKSAKPNKSQAIRDHLSQNPTAAPKDIAAALTEQGIKVSPMYVSTIKGKMGKRRRRRKAAVTMAEKSGIDLNQVKAAFMLLKQCGSLANAKEALASAAEIQKIL
jgi:hypothetical protein